VSESPCYSASAEPVTGYLVRVHPTPGGVIGDPYAAACLAVPRGTTAVVKGFVVREAGTLRESAAVVRAVEEALRDLGFKRLRYERLKGGKAVEFDKEL